MSSGIQLDDGNVHIFGVTQLKVVGGAAQDLGGGAAQLTMPVLFGTVDPTTGAGVAHGLPCLYIRNNANTTELWVTNGTAATAWQKVTVP